MLAALRVWGRPLLRATSSYKLRSSKAGSPLLAKNSQQSSPQKERGFPQLPSAPQAKHAKHAGSKSTFRKGTEVTQGRKQTQQEKAVAHGISLLWA